MREFTATVVGGGLSGLASAVSLARAGWRTKALESRSAGEAGAGVALPRNGVTALRALEFDDERVADITYETTHGGFRDRYGRSLLSVADRPDLRAAITLWGVHRQRLHSALLTMAREVGVEVESGVRVTRVRSGSPDGAMATVSWQDEATTQEAESDLVVGADGMFSAVRSELFPTVKARYSGSTSWRAIIPKNGFEDGLVEYLGPSAEFGAMPVSASELYWYGYFRHTAKSSFTDELAAARSRFSGWAPEVAEQLATTVPENLMRHDVYHLPDGPPSYARGRVVLVGDAAHGALPTMGAGAATALEDGVCVGALVGRPVVRGDGDLGRALAEFDRIRRPRCEAIARQARLNARFGADLGGGLRQTLRNNALRLVPGRTLARMAAPLASWTPPH